MEKEMCIDKFDEQQAQIREQKKRDKFYLWFWIGWIVLVIYFILEKVT